MFRLKTLNIRPTPTIFGHRPRRPTLRPLGRGQWQCRGNQTFNNRTADQYLLFEDYDGDGRDDTPPDLHYEAGLGVLTVTAAAIYTVELRAMPQVGKSPAAKTKGPPSNVRAATVTLSVMQKRDPVKITTVRTESVFWTDLAIR